MEEGRQMIQDAQLWALESGEAMHSRAARAAGRALQEYHRDLPELIGSSAQILGKLGIDVGESRTTSRRLLDSATREIIGGGKDSYAPMERSEMMRRTLRDVLIQEAAGHEIERRGGVDPARALDRDPDRGQGRKAIETLRRQNVDIDNMFGHMTEHDLAKTSHGAYNKVSLLAHPHLAKALEAPEEIMSNKQVEVNQGLNHSIDRPRGHQTSGGSRIALQPVRRLQRPVVRQMSFGRKMAQVNAMQAGIG